jgi:Ca-activated chloride channel family protein
MPVFKDLLVRIKKTGRKNESDLLLQEQNPEGGNMNFASRLFRLLPWAVFGLLPTVVLAQGLEEKEDKTLSPYFFVMSDDPATDRLPLKSTSADVTISGVIADVRVTQIYKNEGKNVLEAIYTFPASTRVAVYNMKMTIGERTITARIKEREQARIEYEQAKQDGKTASLLEQQRPNVFQMNVANILPGDEIKVELFYTELIVPTDRVYEFVYPTVVGPRYSNKTEKTASQSEKWIKNPYLHEGQAPPYTFDINVTLAAGMPIQGITCSSHKTSIEYEGKNTAHVSLPANLKDGGNRDFILKYRLAGNEIESGLLLYENEKEKYFLMMLQPPARIEPKDIPPREYIFILDVSGSMHGFPLDISKKLFRDLISYLSPDDKFNMILFAGGSMLFSGQSVKATKENVTKAVYMIENEQGGGGTELLPALKNALTIPASEGYARSILILTDGYVDVEKEAFELIRYNLGRANFFAFGIGSAVNRFLIEGIAKVGMAESFIVTKENEAEEIGNKFRKYVLSPVLSGIRIEYDDFEPFDIEPAAVPDILADRPVIVFGKYKSKAHGKIILKGISGGKSIYSTHLEVSDYKPDVRHAALRYLWARQRIGILGDYSRITGDAVLEKQITELGLAYNLLTDFTSFVAVDEQIRNTDGKIIRVEQPLPLPQGVSDLAVGESRMLYQGSAAGAAAMPKSGTFPHQKMSAQDSQLYNKMGALGGATLQAELSIIKTDHSDVEKLIESYIKMQLPDVKRCYEKNVKSQKYTMPTGSVALKFTVKKNGQVENIVIIKNEIPGKALEKDLVILITTWIFQTANQYDQTVVECTFQFKY